MPIYKTKNENFFKTWSSEMAYVLGFFTADGSMYRTCRGTHFIEFQITDGGLLYEIRDALGSNHQITIIKNGKPCKIIYRLQIGSKAIFNDLLSLGFTPNKSKTVKLPAIPNDYFPDFLRGYFDGDGSVVFGYFKKADRKYLTRTFSVRFTSGSFSILESIQKCLRCISLTGSLFFSGSAWRLNYGASNSETISTLMYKNVRKDSLLYLERKYKIFQDALASGRIAVVA